jgi:hypothetical protein
MARCRVQGFEVIHNRHVDLPSDQQAIQPSQLFEWVTTHTLENAEAVFIGGNGFRAIGIIKALEEKSQSSDPDGEPSRILASPCAIRIGRADRRLRPNIWPQTTGVMKPLQCSHFDFRCWPRTEVADPAAVLPLSGAQQTWARPHLLTLS